MTLGDLGRRVEGGQLDLFLTCVAYSVTAWSKVDTLWAGASVTTRSEETQMAAGSLTGVVDCKHREIALLQAHVAREDYLKVTQSNRISPVYPCSELEFPLKYCRWDV